MIGFPIAGSPIWKLLGVSTVKVEHWDPARDGPLEERALRKRLEARGYAVRVYRYPPGTYFAPHSHEIDKIDAVLEGRFRMVIGEEDRVLEPGDALFVPAGTVHSAEVIGDEEVVSLDATKA
jgi:quercetin dioxygenase-like cupin family protein